MMRSLDLHVCFSAKSEKYQRTSQTSWGPWESVGRGRQVHILCSVKALRAVRKNRAQAYASYEIPPTWNIWYYIPCWAYASHK